MARGHGETYHEQRWSVDFVSALARDVGDTVTVICVNTARHQERLDNGVVAMGLPLWHGATQRDLVDVVARTSPTHVVLRSPILGVIAWAAARHVRLLPLLADAFGCDVRVSSRLREAMSVWLLSRLRCVANKQVNACCSLVEAGVAPGRVVPWDWPKRPVPKPSPRPAPLAGRPVRLVHASSLLHSKGVGDAIRAVAVLRDRGVAATLTVIGEGPDGQSLASETHALGLDSAVRFVGRVALDSVVPAMRQHDAVVVATRPEYPEALPNTLLQTWRSGTPLVASDHPMFRGLVVDGETGLSFRAGDAGSLADALLRLHGDGALYEKLSCASAAALARLPRAAPWDDVLTRFLYGGLEDPRWLQDNSLRSSKYHDWVARYWPSLLAGVSVAGAS